MNQNNFMSFYFDQQTNKDLDLFNIHTNDNIFNYFNKKLHPKGGVLN